jgi:hypothetical protein
MKISQKYKATNIIAQLLENLTIESKVKTQSIRKHERRKNGRYIQNEIFEEDTKQFYRITHSLMELSPSWQAANCAATQ